MADIMSLIKDEIRGYSRTEWTGEINGTPITLYSKPLCAADNAKVLRRFPDFNTSMNYGGMAEYILVKAETADGKLAFAADRDRPYLNRWSQDRISDVFQALFRGQLDDIDDDEERVGN
jgi:hypothetical protein